MKRTIDSLFRDLSKLDGELRSWPTASQVEPQAVRDHLTSKYGAFEQPTPRGELVDDVLAMLREWAVHVIHPRYFGLFNPAVHDSSVVADTLVAAFNPQLAAWSHAPAANEIERHLISFLASRIGDASSSVGHFTSGGAEANQSALLTALIWKCSAYAVEGVTAFAGRPTVYVSAEAHHSLHKAARAAGIGTHAVRVIPVDAELRLDTAALNKAIAEDQARGFEPVLVVGTAGTTGAGIIDPLIDIAEICQHHGLWFHADAAWGGSALMSATQRGHLAGIEQADSVTWDAHKWLSVPMGAGMFFCRHPDAVAKAFSMDTGYMPAASQDATEPHSSSAQWSRRFIGLKLFMPMAELGAHGMAAKIDHQTAMGELLRRLAIERGFSVVNQTPLPVICLTHPRIAIDGIPEFCQRVVERGRVWVSPVSFSDGRRAIRACVTSFRTQPADIEALIDELEQCLDEI